MIFGMNIAISRVGWARPLTRPGLLFLALAKLFGAGSPLYAAASGPSAGLSVEELISGLAKRNPEVASFEETTFSVMVTEPLKTRGFLKFTPPSRLEKHVTDPYEERYVIDGDKLLFESKRKRVNKTLSLDDYPALRIFVEALRSTLAGDSITLKRFYRATVEGELRRWTLMLKPLDRASQTLIESVRVSGEGHRITMIETRAPDGDGSILVVTKVVP
jgi:hypothetical protein